MPALLPLVENRRLAPEDLVTHHFSLREGAAAYRTFADRAPGTGKVVLHTDDLRDASAI